MAGSNGNKEDNKNNSESVFGPNIGLVSSGPSWTQSKEKKVLVDELTADVVRSWVEKSKDPTQPTTTLQALVNLKRPTLRLSPLAPSTDSSEDTADLPQQNQHHHGLEFEFDCDAPKCGIYVHVLLPPEHPEATNSSYNNAYSPAMTKVLVYENVVEGGFGKALKIADGAILELGRYDLEQVQSLPTLEQDAASSPSTGITVDIATQEPSSENNNINNSNNSSNANTRNARRRFTHFHFRRRTHAQNRSVSGPALAVLDADPTNAPDATSPTEEGVTASPGNHRQKNDKNKKEREREKGGVRVMIRLAALDEQGTELSSPNEQITYLHVLRFGAKVRSKVNVGGEGNGEGGAEGGGAGSGGGGGGGGVGVEEVEDTRPWVVKVVKREATIGPHTFQLQEIFGLSSTSNTTHTSTPTAPLPTTPPPTTTHTYPPTSTTLTPSLTISPAIPEHHEEDPSSECLLCLSSPREVVLLPCRHLVACKECALNMVEFGAGGNITQAEEPVGSSGNANANANTPSNLNAGNTEGNEGNNSEIGEGVATHVPATPMTPPPAPPPPPTTTNARRKRKAKGWFCPVCRQPYTSLLRLTTVPPPQPPPSAVENNATGSDPLNVLQSGVTSSGGAPATSTTTSAATSATNTASTTNNAATGANSANSARPGFSFRPSFLRGFSGRTEVGVVGDVENQVGQVGAVRA